MIRTLQKIFSPMSFCGCIGALPPVRPDGRCSACGRISGVPSNWHNEFNAALENTVIKSKEIFDLKAMMKRPTVEQVETALHLYEEAKKHLGTKTAMRFALPGAFDMFGQTHTVQIHEPPEKNMGAENSQGNHDADVKAAFRQQRD